MNDHDWLDESLKQGPAEDAAFVADVLAGLPPQPRANMRRSAILAAAAFVGVAITLAVGGAYDFTHLATTTTQDAVALVTSYGEEP